MTCKASGSFARQDKRARGHEALFFQKKGASWPLALLSAHSRQQEVFTAFQVINFDLVAGFDTCYYDVRLALATDGASPRQRGVKTASRSRCMSRESSGQMPYPLLMMKKAELSARFTE